MKIKKRTSCQKKVKRTIEQRIDAHAGLKKCGLICYSNAIIQCVASCSYLTDFLRCSPNEEHERFQLYFEFTSVVNSLVSGGGDVVNLKKLNTLYRGNENFKQDEGKYHYNPMDKWIHLSLMFTTNKQFILPYFQRCTWVHNGPETVLTRWAPASVPTIR